MSLIDDTIIALATPPLESALAIIRISGSKSFSIINKMFSREIELKTNNAIFHGKIIDENRQQIDDCVVFAYKAPFSFTGDDVVEISCHGSLLIINKIIEIAISLGARLAEKGEFTKKAFYNGKLDLLQAESINDLITSKSNAAVKLALSGINGNISNNIKKLKSEIVEIISHIDVNIDYPEYDDIEQLTSKILKPKIEELILKLTLISKETEFGKIIKNGINVAIVGRPNVGKSSILNALIKEDKAIVSEYEGTTRDVVEGQINLSGLNFNFLDTAGIRDSHDFVEKIGIKKSKEVIDKADLIIFVTDTNGELTKQDNELLSSIINKKKIIVYNKKDKTSYKSNKEIVVSAKNQEIQPLIDSMLKIVGFKLEDYENKPLLSNARQKGQINKALKALQDALQACNNQAPSDIIEIDVRESLRAIQELLGEVYKENLEDEIFSKFCLGK
ncbi:MAG: tRNA uridine-5-carboxymethylaminomethyl(34) synthesis GTPase MnmE [Bacilli bacterium]|nr:tRNA uridine-5-carboxymethylaminomethyl(34) synthesis GTPase MnmE [Bacilli bacterium]